MDLGNNVDNVGEAYYGNTRTRTDYHRIVVDLAKAKTGKWHPCPKIVQENRRALVRQAPLPRRKGHITPRALLFKRSAAIPHSPQSLSHLSRMCF